MGTSYDSRIRFKWHGIRGGGCTFPLGVCLVIPINPPKPHEADDSEEVDLDIQNGKLSIAFNEYSDSNFGLTTDGYLPILEDVHIPNEIAKQYNLEDISIKSGIYKAVYDDTRDKYIGVVVDIVSL
ncbi:MAG: hypothetical protein COZ18_13780 [Flexibacter sp. CG_4_10_14_3_um_filter_32_15]|nr:MAG: hypothetical protein COZ18_13780 [Flexibacter sp. CG_4_10_14_3_um_filter_32_15]